MQPLVSVVIPTYNQAWCIQDTINSVLGQTYKNIEIIVVDDASTDDTSSRIAPFRDRLTYIKHNHNRGYRIGAAISRNTGIRKARGEFIAFLDGDDLWEPDKLTVQVAVAQDNPHSGLIAVDGIRFSDLDGRVISHSLLSGSPAESLSQGAVMTSNLYERLFQDNFIYTPSQVMVPSCVLREVGLFDEIFGEDYDLWIRIATHYEITLVKAFLMRWRYRPTNNSGPLAESWLRFAPTSVRIWKKHLKVAHPGIRPKIRKRIVRELKTVCEHYYSESRNGRKLWATGRLLDLLREAPTSMTVVAFLAGIWCPQWVVRPLKQSVHKLLSLTEWRHQENKID